MPYVADDVVAEIRGEAARRWPRYDSVDSPEGGQAIVATASDAFGRLDAVVSNAGIFQTHPFDDLTSDDWRRMLACTSTGRSTSASPHTGS